MNYRSLKNGGEPELGLPGDVANGLRYFLVAVMQFAADPRLPTADHDLVALWEAHCRYEFETRASVEVSLR
jgi:hypothetical protein